MSNMYDQKRFDKRLIDRHLAGGAIEMARITDEELKKHLDALPDLADKCEPVSIVQPMWENKENGEDEDKDAE